MKATAIKGIGTVVTRQTAPGYIARLAGLIYEDLSPAASAVFDAEAARVVNAGFLTWSEVEEIEIKALKNL